MRQHNHSQNQFWHKWLNSLKRLWRSLVNSLRVLFSGNVSGNVSGNLDGERNSRSRRSRQGSQSTLNSEGVIVIPRPAIFLIGLDDLPNLESLTTKELIDQIAWNVESSEILLAKEEDLSLLEDLLVNFPES